MSLLAELRHGFRDKPENIATRSLAYVLRSYPDVRDAWLHHFVRRGLIADGNLTIIDQRGTAQGQPDLQGRDEAGQIRLLVEAKFDAGLTPNQPLGYLQLLSTVGRGCLLFLVPASRLEPLYQTFRGLCGTAITSESDRVIHLESRALALQTWNAALDIMLDKAHDIQSDEAISDFRQLKGLCQALEGDAFQPFSREELTSISAPKLFSSLLGLIPPLSQCCRDRGWQVGKMSPIYGGYTVGLYFARIGINLEVNADLWLRFQQSPLWLRTNFDWDWNASLNPAERRSVQEALRSASGSMLDDDGGYYAPLLIPDGVEKDEVLASLTRQVDAVRVALVASGLAAPKEGEKGNGT